MEVITVELNKINRSLFRLDAEHHVGINKINLNKYKGKKLSDLCSKVIQGPNPKFIEDGIPSLNGKNIYFGTLDAGEPNFISEEEYLSFKSYHLQRNDLLITLKHASRVGRLWIYRKNGKCLFSRNLGLIRLKKGAEIYPETLLFYLWGNVSQQLLNLIATGGTNGQITLSMAELREFSVPEFSKSFQDKIRSIFNFYEELVKNSESLFQQAQHLLLAELFPINWQPKHRLTFVKNYSDTLLADRIDAEYYQPKYDEIVAAIKNYSGGWETLGNLVNIKKGVEVGSEEYLDKGIPFVRVSNLSPFEVTEEKYISESLYRDLTKEESETKSLPKQARFKKSRSHQPMQGEILFSKDATPGIAYYLRNEPPKMILSGGILRLLRKDNMINDEYLTLVLNSLLTKEQANRDCGGSVILHWRPDQVKETLIPILPDYKQTKIQQKVTETFSLRKQSKQLLECAKHALEIAIEKDEQAAMHWLESQSFEMQR